MMFGHGRGTLFARNFYIVFQSNNILRLSFRGIQEKNWENDHPQVILCFDIFVNI